MKVKHCGKCRHFKHEDACGNGWCEKHEEPTHCGKECMENGFYGKIPRITKTEKVKVFHKLSHFYLKTERLWKRNH